MSEIKLAVIGFSTPDGQGVYFRRGKPRPTVMEQVERPVKKIRSGYPCDLCKKPGYFASGKCNDCRTRVCVSCGLKHLPQKEEASCAKCRVKILSRIRNAG